MTAAFRRDGYLLVRTCGRLRRRVLSAPRWHGCSWTVQDSSGARMFAPDTTAAELLRVCTKDPLRAAVRSVIGARVEFLSVKPAVKTARITAASPSHQDWPNKVSAWIALGPSGDG